MSCAVPKFEMRLSQVSASQMRSSVSRNVQEFVGEKRQKRRVGACYIVPICYANHCLGHAYTNVGRVRYVWMMPSTWCRIKKNHNHKKQFVTRTKSLGKTLNRRWTGIDMCHIKNSSKDNQLEFGMYPQSMPTEWTHARKVRPWQSVRLDLWRLDLRGL